MTLRRNSLNNRAPLINAGLELRGDSNNHALLSPEALTFVRSLTRRFRSARNSLIEKEILKPKIFNQDIMTTLNRQKQNNQAILVRNLNLEETQMLVDGQNIPAGILDVGLFLFHFAKNFKTQPEVLLPMLSHHLEARFWNDLLLVCQDELGMPRGTVRVSVSSNNQKELQKIYAELRDHTTQH